jgi:hypothetical protein
VAVVWSRKKYLVRKVIETEIVNNIENKETRQA